MNRNCDGKDDTTTTCSHQLRLFAMREKYDVDIYKLKSENQKLKRNVALWQKQHDEQARVWSNRYVTQKDYLENKISNLDAD